MIDEVRETISRLSGPRMAELPWMHLTGSDRFDYPIDYSIAVLDVQPATGRIDFVAKWAPHAYCHFHRHNTATTIAVLEGEHHVVEETATETVHKTRKPGHMAHNPTGDVHMEYGGPEGAVVFFAMQTSDGRLFDVLDRKGNVLRAVTLDDFAKGTL